MHTFDIIVTCMGRLEHLKQSLPLALKQVKSRVILVDYSCPDFCGDWAESLEEDVLVVRVKNQQYFNISKARNAGAKHSESKWLIFLDADVLLSVNFTKYLIDKLAAKKSFHATKNGQRGSMGTFCCERQDFISLGGFDEVIQGWGCEDGELFERFTLAGIRQHFYPNNLISGISHSDEDRTKHYQSNVIEHSHILNRIYLLFSRDFTRIFGRWPEEKNRKEIYNLIKHKLIDIKNHHSNDIQIKFREEKLRGNKLESFLTLKVNEGNKKPQTYSEPFDDPNTINATIETFSDRWPEFKPSSELSPVLLLSSGFRCGSTLLQRMLIKNCYMWGEPYGRAGWFEHLIAPFTQISKEWPADDFFNQHPKFQDDLGQTWVANMYPAPENLCSAAQSYIEALLYKPSNKQHWGLKEVRWNASHAGFFKWLYPQSKLLFLYRNPYQAYISYRRYQAIWYIRAPDRPIDTPEAFGRHWVETTKSFLDSEHRLDALVIKYEDLVSANYNFTSLQNYLGFELDTSALEKKVQGVPMSGFANDIKLEGELIRLQQVTEPLSKKLGYEMKSES